MTEQEMRELDAWIAEHGFGWDACWIPTLGGFPFNGEGGPFAFGTFSLERECKAACFGELEPAMAWRKDDVFVMMLHHWRPSMNSSSLSLVKREIERRGWSWQAAHNFQEGGYDFGIFNPADSVIHSLDGEETEVARILAIEHAETEELAGCLAFKAAVEAAGEN